MPPPARHFGDRLAAAVEARRSQVVLGLDPDPARLWPAGREAGDRAEGSAAERAAEAVAAHCEAAIDAVAEACVAVKPQLACFERLGAHGWRALERVSGSAQARGLLVLADAKRGDIDVSAAARCAGESPGVAAPAGAGHRRAGSGSSPRTTWDSRAATRRASRSAKC